MATAPSFLTERFRSEAPSRFAVTAEPRDGRATAVLCGAARAMMLQLLWPRSRRTASATIRGSVARGGWQGKQITEIVRATSSEESLSETPGRRRGRGHDDRRTVNGPSPVPTAIVGVAGAVVAEERALYGLRMLGASRTLAAIATVMRKHGHRSQPRSTPVGRTFRRAISLVMEAAYPGIVPSRCHSRSHLFALLAAYRSFLSR